MKKIKVSVVICSHNPRQDYIERVLGALKPQTLSRNEWELLLIDNVSKDPLNQRIDLSWHPSGRHVREDKLGLTPARLRGISESAGDIIVFVDDDNVLNSDYLSKALVIATQHQFLGCWAGAVSPVFEDTPPEWTKAFWGLLALRDVKEDAWANMLDAPCTPAGAGLCVRRVVAEAYVRHVREDKFSTLLGRKGETLISGEDYDLVLQSRAVGLGWGLFRSLQLQHLIPRERLTEDYLLRLVEGMSATDAIFKIREDPTSVSMSQSHVVRRMMLLLLKGEWRSIKFLRAEWRGRLTAQRLVSELE